jgi:hypothetical protein
MTTGRLTGFGFAVTVLAGGLADGCVSEGDLASGPTVADPAIVAEAVPAEQSSAAADLARLVEAAQPTRTEEAGVTVIRGAMPPALAALATPMPISTQPHAQPLTQVEPLVTGPATGGSLVAAALNQGGGVQTAAAPGALASVDQLAALQAQPAVPVEVAQLTDTLPAASYDAAAPAAGSGSVTTLTQSDDPIVEQVQRLASISPVSVQELEARGATRMSTEEITALTVGNTVTHTNADNGFSVATYYDPTGESRLINDGRGMPSRFQISDGARCRIDSQGVGICALLYREGDTTWVCDQRDQGICNWYVSKVEPGFIDG